MTRYIVNKTHRLVRKYKTRNPMEIADALGINVWDRDIGGMKGYYTYCLRNRYIVVNSQLSDAEQQIVCAHELGHDRLHQTFAKNCTLQDFMTCDMTTRPEREANIFAVSLMLPDEEIIQHIDLPTSHIASIFGIHEKYIQLKINLLTGRTF